MNRYALTMVIIAGSLFGPASSQASVIINNIEWKQLTDIGSYSYTSFDTVFDATGAGTGSLGGVDFIGWTWATQQDVNDLFATYFGGTFTGFQSGILPEADAYFADFQPMGFDAAAEWNYAWTLDHHAVEVTNRFSGTDFFNTNHSLSSSNNALSAYVYRNAASVPEPAPGWSVGLGLIGLFGIRKYQMKLSEKTT